MSDDAATVARKLWDAVDRITSPSKARVPREEDADWLQSLSDDPTLRVCDVAAYRAATAGWADVPSLWDQATWALTTGNETSGGNPSPLASRSPADLDLMEMMLTIREVIGLQLDGRRITAKATVPLQMRQLAAHVVTHEPEHVAWWEYRFASWARQLGVYLKAVETGPKPVRLRCACPLCKTRQITIEENGEEKVVPPILIDFVNGWIRAATCLACTAVWWRGNELGELAALLDTPIDETACPA